MDKPEKTSMALTNKLWIHAFHTERSIKRVAARGRLQATALAVASEKNYQFSYSEKHDKIFFIQCRFLLFSPDAAFKIGFNL